LFFCIYFISRSKFGIDSVRKVNDWKTILKFVKLLKFFITVASPNPGTTKKMINNPRHARLHKKGKKLERKNSEKTSA